MDYRVYDASDGEHSAHDGAYIYQKVKKVLLGLLVLHGNGRQLVVEHEHRLLCVEVADGILGELVHLVAGARGVGEVGGDSYQVEVGLQVLRHRSISQLLPVGFLAVSIEGVHDSLIGEASLNDLEVLVSAEADVVDFVTEIEVIALHHQAHQNVTEGMARNVEISRDTIDLKVTLKLAALLLLNLFFDSIK